MADTIDTLEIEVVTSADPAIQSIQKLSSQMEQFGKSLKGAMPSSNGFSESLKKLGETFKGIGTQMTNAGKLFAPLSTALAGIGTISVKTAADFEVQMSKVQAISGASSSDMEKLSASAKEWGANSKFSATEAALSPVLLLGGKVTTMIGESMVALSGLVSGTGTLSTAFTTLTGPVGVGVAAVAAFTAGMVTTAATNDSVKANLAELAAGFESTLVPAVQNLSRTVLADLNAGWQRL